MTSTSRRSKPPTVTTPVTARKYAEAIIAFRTHHEAPVAFPGVRPEMYSHSKVPRGPTRQPSTSSEDSHSTIAEMASRFMQSMESLIGVGSSQENVSEESQNARELRIRDPFRASPHAASFIPNPESSISHSEFEFSSTSAPHVTVDAMKSLPALPSESFGYSSEHSGVANQVGQRFDDGVSVGALQSTRPILRHQISRFSLRSLRTKARSLFH